MHSSQCVDRVTQAPSCLPGSFHSEDTSHPHLPLSAGDQRECLSITVKWRPGENNSRDVAIVISCEPGVIISQVALCDEVEVATERRHTEIYVSVALWDATKVLLVQNEPASLILWDGYGFDSHCQNAILKDPNS